MYSWIEREIFGIQNREIRGLGIVFCVAICAISLVAYSKVFLAISFFLNIHIPSVNNINIYLPNFNPVLFLVGIIFVEEVFFRYLPLSLAVQKGWSMNKVLMVAILFSTIFGLYHGNVKYIFNEGIGGFVLSILFLKCGGSQGNYVKGFAVTTATHFLYMVLLPLMFTG